MVAAQRDGPTIFAAAGGSVLIAAVASILMGLLPRATTPDAFGVTASNSPYV
jgi:hypothetical protein